RGGFVSVAYFRGGGTGSYRQQQPSVTSSVIYRSLFHMNYFDHVFHSAVDHRTTSDDNGIINKHSLYYDENFKIPLTIRTAKSPVTIGDNLNYFWGKEYLPDENAKDCFNYVSSNKYTYISMCNVDEMERCSRNMSDLTELYSFTFSTQ
ncbi:hypothetical protein PFISCL1PPCAC_2479, partial [Pristionchus fissidentatus]